MTNQDLENLLVQHADQLNQGVNNTELYLALYPNDKELHTLLELSDWLHETLVPLHPSHKFIYKLHRKLLNPQSQSSIPFSYQLLGGTMISLLGLFLFWQKMSDSSIVKATEQN